MGWTKWIEMVDVEAKIDFRLGDDVRKLVT